MEIEPLIRKKIGGLELKLEHETLCIAWSVLVGSPRPNTLTVKEEEPTGQSIFGKKKKIAVQDPSFEMPKKCLGSVLCSSGILLILLSGYPLRLKKWKSKQIDAIEKFQVCCNFFISVKLLYNCD